MAPTAPYEPLDKITFQTWRGQDLNRGPLELWTSSLPTEIRHFLVIIIIFDYLYFDQNMTNVTRIEDITLTIFNTT
jgi:hypothetical protein